jgi:hypothetical protein
MPTTVIDDLYSINALAKLLHRERINFKRALIGAGLAIRWGGSDKRPTLKFRLSEAQKWILEQRYYPPGEEKQIKRRATYRPGVPLDPAVTC